MSECTHFVHGKFGVEQFVFDTEDGDTVCINTTVFPLFLGVHSFGDDTLFHKYHSLTNTMDEATDFLAPMKFLKDIQFHASAFGSFSLHTPSDTHLQFTLAGLPGMCTNGVLLSSYQSDSLFFKKNTTGFFGLNIFDDKCIVFTSPGNQTINLQIQSRDTEDQVFIYKTPRDFLSINGNTTHTATSPAGSPFIIRVVADDYSPPDWVSITMNSDGEPPRYEERHHVIPADSPDLCPATEAWFNEKTAIGLLVSAIVVGLGTIVLFSIECICSGNSGASEYQSMAFSGTQHLDSMMLGSVEDITMYT